MPSVSIYRPPAARKLEQNAREQNQTNERKKCSKEPEDTGPNLKKPEDSGISMFRNAISGIRTQNGIPKSKVVENDKTVKSSKEVKNVKQRRPDMKVYVPRGRRIAENKAQPSKISEQNETNQNGDSVNKSDYIDDKPSDIINKSDELIIKTDELVNENKSNELVAEKVTSYDKSDNDSKPSQTSLWIEAQNETQPVTKKVINSSQPYEDSDSTAISSSDNSNSNSLRNSCEKISDIKEVKKTSSVPLNPDECDWETMYDDSGECLDPSLLDQLSSAVGQVTIEKPKSNYNGFKTKTLDMVGDEFPHVIEIYNFPPEFQLQDLMTVFSQFKNSGFEIKWVDDTHALGIFSSSAIVSEVLAFHHPFVKTRSLKEGTPLSKTKARKSAEFLLPFKPRPDTCPALARRLVTGALGVRLPTSREEREAERKILMKAREKKRLEAKQKEEAWEGTFS